MEIKIGDFVKYSEEGLKTLRLLKPYRTGKVVAFSINNKDCIKIQWDGRETTESINKRFLEIVTT